MAARGIFPRIRTESTEDLKIFWKGDSLSTFNRPWRSSRSMEYDWQVEFSSFYDKKTSPKGVDPPVLLYACASWCHSLGRIHNWAVAMQPLPVCNRCKSWFGFGIPYKKTLLVDTVTGWGCTPKLYIAFSKKWLRTPGCLYTAIRNSPYVRICIHSG